MRYLGGAKRSGDPCVRAGEADFTADDGTVYTPSGTVAFDLSITDIDLTGVRASFSYESTEDNSTAFSVEVGGGGWMLSPRRQEGLGGCGGGVARWRSFGAGGPCCRSDDLSEGQTKLTA